MMSTNVQYINGMQARLDKWDADLDALRTKGRGIATDARTAYFGRISDLRSSRDAGHRAFVAVRAAGVHDAALLQAGMNTAWRRMSLALEKVVSELQK